MATNEGVLAINRPYPVAVIGGNMTDAARMLTPDPKEVAYSNGAGMRTIDIDLGATQVVGGIYLGGVSGDVTFTMSGGSSYTDQALGNLFVAPKRTATAPRKYYALMVPTPARYVRLSAVLPDGFSIGRVAVCERFSPAWGHEWGSGRSPIDLGVATRNRAGGFGIESGAIVTGWDFTLGDLTDLEREVLFDFLMKVGETNPVIVAENPQITDDLDVRLHYGLFRRLEKYERQHVNVVRWSFKVEDWA